MNNRDRIARAVVAGLLRRADGGTVDLVDASGRERFGAAGPTHQVRVADPRFYVRGVLREGSVGLGESYAEGWWDTDDLAGFLRLLLENLKRTHRVRDAWQHLVRPVVDPVARRRRPDPQRDEHNVRAHYDVGNELFRRVLDETMMYSCAVFESTDASLEAASTAKLARLCTLLELHHDDHVLEIGTGWGGFAVYAATTFGCRVTTTTISAEQFAFATERVRAAGVEHLVTVRADDYRDLGGQFDKIVAIEMIEAVDWREYEGFFADCRRLLGDAGLLVMQAIVLPDRSFDRAKRRTDFIKAAIFPGSCLPSVGALTTAATRTGRFTPVHLDDIGTDYAETLRRWRANLVARCEELAAFGYDDRFIRLWEFYFSYCEAGFDARYVSDVQLVYATPGWRPARLAANSGAPRHRALATA